MLNDKYFPKDSYGHPGDFMDNAEVEGFKYPHLQLRNVSYSVRKGRKEEVLLDMISVEARGGELVALLSSKGKARIYLDIDSQCHIQSKIPLGCVEV